MQRQNMPVPLRNPREPRRNAHPTGARPSAAVAVAGRIALVALLLVSTGGTVWAVSLTAAPDAVPAAAAGRHVVALPPVPPLQLAPAVQPPSPAPATAAAPAPAARTMAHRSAASATPAPPDPLRRWAADTAVLLGVPAPELTGYGAADLATQQASPDCRLSWITLAAIGRVGSDVVRPQAGEAAALAAAKTLCAGGHDTGTADGWVPAVRSVGDGTAYVQRVLAVATSYATAVRSDDPLTRQARMAIDFAAAQIGLPYVWGGNGPRRGDAGFDCSGLTTAAYAAAGVGLPRTAHTQYFATPRIAELRPGDLVFYGNPATKIHHVGLYIGNGQMINAPTFGQPVQLEPFRSAGDHFAGAGRPS